MTSSDAHTKDLQFLLTLLDDESEDVYGAVREKLISLGPGVVTALRGAAESDSLLIRERARTIAEKIIGVMLRSQFAELLLHNEGGDIDLEKAVFLLARYEYPALDVKMYTEMLNLWATELKARLAGHDDPAETLSLINDFFIREKGLQGNRENYYDPGNSYIKCVMDTRKGIPISLSVVYLLVTRRINIPLDGIGMPSHFVLKYTIGEKELFIDPFNGGQFLSREQCIQFIESDGFGFALAYLEKVSNRQIIERMIRNLIYAYQQKNETDRVETLAGVGAVFGGNLYS